MFTCPGCGANYVGKNKRMLYEQCVEHDGVIETVLWKITSIGVLKCCTYLRLHSLQNNNFWKRAIWNTGSDFFFRRKVMFHSLDIQVCIFNHSMIYQISDLMMSISTWNRVHFWIYLLNQSSLTHQTWLTDRYKQGEYDFWNVLNDLEGWD